MEWVASTLTPPPNVVYPALLKLMHTPRLPVVDWTDAPTDLNGLVRFGERRNLVAARVPSRSARAIQLRRHDRTFQETRERETEHVLLFTHGLYSYDSFTCSAKNSGRLKIQHQGPASSYMLTTKYIRHSRKATLPGQWSIFPLRRIRSALTFSIYRAFHVKGTRTMCRLLHQHCAGKDAALRYENTWKQWRHQCRRIC